MTMVCGDMGLGMSTWSIFTEPYLDVPQNSLPHIHWPGDAEHVLLGAHDNDVRECGAHVLSMQDHPCGTTPWQATPRSPVQRCMLGAELLCVAECAIPWRRAGDGFQLWLLRFIHLSCVQDQDGNQP
jgi:hypothetical protein